MNQFACAFMIVFFVMASQISPNPDAQEQDADTVFKEKQTQAYISPDADNTFFTLELTAQRISLPEEQVEQAKKQLLKLPSR